MSRQFTEVDAAPVVDAAPAPASSVFAPLPSQTAAPSSDDRPARNPGIHERHPPPSRVGATMRGGVILALLVFMAGYWIMKRVKRRYR